MAGFDGNGVWTRSFSWTTDAANGLAISSSRMDTEWSNITSGFNNTLTRDGQGRPSAAINWNAQDLTNVAAFAAVSGTFSGALNVGGALTVTGAFSPASLAVVGAATVGTTLVVTGATGMASFTTSGNGAVTGTFGVTGNMTGTTATFSGIVAVAAASTIGGMEIGTRRVSRSTTTTTAVAADAGKCIAITAGLTIPNAVFAAGDAISIYNDSAGALTITQGASLTLRLNGTATTGNRSLPGRGLCTIWFNSSSEGIIGGGGVS